MPEQLPGDPTVDQAPAPSPLDAGLAAAFAADSGAPLPVGASVLRALGASLPEVPRVQLREPEAATLPPPDQTGESDAGVSEQASVGRLRLDGEIARGGMGAVLKGHDTDLGRDLAVKVLLETHAGKTELLQRFIEEARIAGQLQHPGVVPVYELGRFADRRPYFTMKLVKGQTLARLLAERKDPGQERPRFLKVFEQVCQTLAYAHARGVIHRDLKPSNIMVGAFGVVQVMDWGLAKVLASRERERPEDEASRERPRAEDGTVVRTRSVGASPAPGGGTHTEVGSVLGTLAYMAPEQARGEVDQLDERCDVFGLGAILCELLTGKPPYVAPHAEQLHCMAVMADLDDARARLDVCGADADLVRLARSCLAPEAKDRPRHAGILAAELTTYLESVEARLRQAELSRAEARAKAQEARKRLKLVLALAASVLALVVIGGGAAAWWWQDQTARTRDVATALAEARGHQEAGRWAEARAALERAEGRLAGGGSTALRKRVEEARADLVMVDRLDAARLRLAELRDGGFDERAADQAYHQAFTEYGLDVAALDPDEAARRVSRSSVRAQLVAALDDWAFRTAGQDAPRQKQLLAIARSADPDPWRVRVRDAILARDRAALDKLASRPDLATQPPATLVLLAKYLAAAGAMPRAVEVLRQAQRRYPEDFWINHDLGWYLVRTKPARTEEAVGFFRAAVALRPASPGIHINLGHALMTRGNLAEAEAACRKAIELRPDYAEAWGDVGSVLAQQHKLTEAIAACRQAIRLKPDFAPFHAELGVDLMEQGKLPEAAAACRRAIEIAPNLGEAYVNLGDVLLRQGKLDEAIAALRKGAELSPDSAEAQNDLGFALSRHGKDREAVPYFRKAIRIRPDYLLAHENLALALSALGDREGAMNESRAIIRLDPRDVEHRYNLASALMQRGDLDDAVALFREAIALKPDYAEAYCNLGAALQRQGRLAESLASYRRGHELGSRRPGWPYPSAEWLREAEQLVALEGRFAEFQDGKFQPKDNAERLGLAKIGLLKQAFPTAARLFAEAGDRYDAACCAARAGTGQGPEAARLDAAGRARLRNQACAWLRAELGDWTKRLDSARPADRLAVQQQLQRWQRNSDLAGVRDRDALAKLPADEREAWRKLWGDVEVLRQQATRR